jgi:DNA-binding MarR family transcriptional regulator
MGLVHRHKEKYDGRRVFVYSLTPKGRKYVRWVISSSQEKDDFGNQMAELWKMLVEWSNVCTVNYQLFTGHLHRKYPASPLLLSSEESLEFLYLLKWRRAE